MNKYNNPRLLNAVVSGTGMKHPMLPHVVVGDISNGFIRGDLMDANAIVELVNNSGANIDQDAIEKAVADIIGTAPENLDTIGEVAEVLIDMLDPTKQGSLAYKIANLENILTDIENIEQTVVELEDINRHPMYVGSDYFVYNYNVDSGEYNKSDIYLKGADGAVGPQGPQGDTIILGDGLTYTLYNTTGQNTDGAMTQKTVTDALVAENISYDNAQSGLVADNVQEAVDELAEAVDVSLSGTSAFEKGQIDDNGNDSTAAATYYVRTPASSPIPIINGQTMNLQFIYRNSSGTITATTRIYKYLDGVFVSYVQTSATTAEVVCDGTFNQLRIRGYKSNIGDQYSRCSVNYRVEKSLKDVTEQVDTNTADIASIAANLQGISATVENMEGQTINKRVYTSADLRSSYYDLENPYQTTGSYSIYGGVKVPVKRGDHVVLYTKASSGAARAWGLVDEYRKVLSRTSSTDFLTTPAEIDVTQDCYLCANFATNKSAEKAQFNLTIISNLKTQVEGAVTDLKNLAKRAPQFCNNPFPFKGDALRVLSLGNSFAEDTSAHLEGMMNAAGLDKSKFCYYFTFKSGATLAQYAADYVAGTSYSCIDKSGSYSTTPRVGNYSMPNSSGSLKRILSQDWDLILLQQASTDAYEWSSYIPYITRLVNYIKQDCPKACIGFMLTWATTYTGTTHAPSYAQRYEMNVNCAKKVLHEVGIDFIVAPGTAIQNARNTSLEDSDHLLRDDRHLNTGIGRYVAGCAFFDAVIAPFYGVSVVGNSYTTNAGTPVTDDNKLLCQQCGHAAVANMFEVTTGLEPTYTVTFKDGNTIISTTTSYTGAAVDIPANPEKEGYIFSGWSTDGTTVVTPVSTIGTSDIIYIAVWEEITS